MQKLGKLWLKTNLGKKLARHHLNKLLYGTRKEGKEKRMIKHQQYLKHNICEGRGYKDVY
jgi:hypothetical protein